MFNSCTFVGHLGKEPKRVGQVAMLSLGVGEGEKQPDGTWVNRTLWLDVTCFGRDAEQVLAYPKGARVLAVGRVGVRTYTNKMGKDVTVLTLKASQIKLMDRREGGPRADEDTPF